MPSDSGTHTIELNGITITWELDEGRVLLLGLPVAILWLNPSLLRVLQPLVEEVGVPLFRMLVAHQSSFGAEDDYRELFTKPGNTIEEGFRAWASSVSVAGWGHYELSLFDEEARRATVIARNPWELQMQSGVAERWGCPFVQGKIIGLFSHAFGETCWADEIIRVDGGAESALELRIYPSDRTIDAELRRLRFARRDEEQRPLRDKMQELWESEERQRAILSSLGEVVFTLDRAGYFTSYHVPWGQLSSHAAASDIVGRHIAHVMPGDVAARITEAMEEVLKTETSRTVMYERELRGEVRYFSTTISALHEPSGDLGGATAIERDVTERVIAEQTLAEKVALIDTQKQAMRAMSTPILEVWDGVLALPIVGAFDADRATELTEGLLAAIMAKRARFAILDLTGVDAIDARAADHFGRIIRAVALLGAECLVCGIQPAVAQSMISLDLLAARTRTFATMRSALAQILR